MGDSSLRHFTFINKNIHFDPIGTSAVDGCQGCDAYEDAPVCADGEQDVHCSGERYRGCNPGEGDCADNPGNPDDKCCVGIFPGTGDNIDHALCSYSDAGWGGLDGCWIFWDSVYPEE